MAEIKAMTVENADIIWLNFEGREDQYNTQGSRNFTLKLTEEDAQILINDGWNVTYIDPREEGEAPAPKIKVAVKFHPFPPTIWLLTSTSRVRLTEETVGMLDGIDIANVDLIIRPYDWAVGDKTGTKAYLKTMFVTLNEDELERKYAVTDNAA